MAASSKIFSRALFCSLALASSVLAGCGGAPGDDSQSSTDDLVKLRSPKVILPRAPLGWYAMSDREREALAIIDANGLNQYWREGFLYMFSVGGGSHTKGRAPAKYEFIVRNGALHELCAYPHGVSPYNVIYAMNDPGPITDDPNADDDDPLGDGDFEPDDFGGSDSSPSIADAALGWLSSGANGTPPPGGIDLGIGTLSLGGINPSMPGLVPGTVMFPSIPADPSNPSAGNFSPFGGALTLTLHW